MSWMSWDAFKYIQMLINKNESELMKEEDTDDAIDFS